MNPMFIMNPLCVVVNLTCAYLLWRLVPPSWRRTVMIVANCTIAVYNVAVVIGQHM